MRYLACCLVCLGALSFAGAQAPRGEEFPELKKLREAEEALQKLRDGLAKEYDAKEKAAAEVAAKARDQWLKTLRDRDPAKSKTAKEAFEAADKELRHIRAVRFEIMRVRMLGLPGPRVHVVRPIDEKLGLHLTRVSDAIADQLGLPKTRGMMIERVTAGSPAEKAGLKAHDIVLAWDGKEMPSDLAAFRKTAGEMKPGAAVTLKVLRRGKEQTIDGLTLPAAEAPTTETPKKGDNPKKAGPTKKDDA
ncbi:MAG: PDZ domain-containing protein [Gemmataceae bacterium]